MILKVTSRIACWGRLLFLSLIGCSRSHLSVRNSPTKVLVSIGLLFFSITPHSYALQLSTDTPVATAGYYQLSWLGKVESFQLQESTAPDFNSFKILYEGKDLARVISGKSDGDYYYRLLSNEGNTSQVSNTVKVTVSHHPLENAVMFFVAGAIVFLAILYLIFKGRRLES